MNEKDFIKNNLYTFWLETEGSKNNPELPWLYISPEAYISKTRFKASCELFCKRWTPCTIIDPNDLYTWLKEEYALSHDSDTIYGIGSCLERDLPKLSNNPQVEEEAFLPNQFEKVSQTEEYKKLIPIMKTIAPNYAIAESVFIEGVKYSCGFQIRKGTKCLILDSKIADNEHLPFLAKMSTSQTFVYVKKTICTVEKEWLAIDN